MSKKHFIALADAIRHFNQLPDIRAFDAEFTDAQIDALAQFCFTQNPRFNTNRWKEYIKQ